MKPAAINPRQWTPEKTQILADRMRVADCFTSLQLYGEEAKSPLIPHADLQLLREVYSERLKELRNNHLGAVSA